MRFFTTLFLFVILSNLAFSESMPDYYSESGFNANRGYETQQAVETIDPFSGGLQLQNIDLVVPGNGGMDIVVNRNYRAISKPTNIENVNYLGNRSVLGIGWDIHFGRVWSGDVNNNFDALCGVRNVSSINNPVLELADGTQKRLIAENNTTGFNRYVTKDRWIGKCLSGGGLAVFSPDGLKYTFGFYKKYTGKIAWNMTRIEDKFNNWISINYHPAVGTQHALIDTVTSSDNRIIKFNYDSEIFKWAILLKSITNTASGQSINYSHHRHANYNDRFFLDKATKSDGSNTTYEYDERLSGGGALSPGHFNLKKMTSPQGTSTNYTFDEVLFSGGVFIATQVLKTKTVSGAGVQTGTWTYNFTPGLTSGFDETQIKSANYCTKYKHKGVRQVSAGEVWKIGTLSGKYLYNSTSCAGTLIQSEIYTWDKSLVSSQNEYHRREEVVDINTYQPVLFKKVISRDNSTFITSFSNFDTYGNPQTKTETGPSSSRTTTYAYSNFIDASTWLIGLVDTTTITGITGNINNDYYSLGTGAKAGKLQQTNRYGAITKYDYDAGGNLRTVTDPENKVITYTNYVRGVPKNEAHPENVNISRIVNLSTGTVASETNGRGKTTSYTYDSLNRIKTINTHKANDSNITVNWSSGGRIRTVTRGGLVSVTTNNGFGKPINVKTGSITKTFRYNAEGQLLFESYSSSAKGTTYIRDVLGRITKLTHPDNSSQIYTYLNNNRVSIQNERFKITTNTYRSYGNPDEKYLMNVAAPEGITTIYTRNKPGQIKSITQGGKTRSYTYNTRYQLETITNPETGVTTFGRDNVGNMTSKKVGTSAITNYRYDDLHRLEFIDYPNEPLNPDVTFVYTKTNNVATVTRNNTIRKFTYDDNDNVATQSVTVDGKVYPLIYSYNGLDNLNTIKYPSGRTITYLPNALGQSTQAMPFVTNVTYHPNGTPNITTFANGVTVTKTLTPNRDWVNTVTATGVIDLDYNYDVRGNITSLTNFLDRSKDISMGYDNVDRLTSANGTWGLGSIGYNAFGNITFKNIGAFQLAYNYNATTNKLSSTTGIVNNTYLYDAYGNIKNNGTDTFVFDDASNMVSVTGSTTLINTYDGKNILVKSDKEGYVTYHLYDNNYNLMGEYNATGSMRKESIRLNGKVIAVVTEVPAKPGQISISTPDATGNYMVNWLASPDELSHYGIAENSNSICDNVTDIATSTTNNLAITNKADGTYYYCVRSCNGKICGDYQSSGTSCAVVGLSSAPCVASSLTVPGYNNTGNLTISWGAATGNVTRYELYEANNINFTGETLVYSGTSLTAALTARVNGNYYYRVRACNNGVCGNYNLINTLTRVVLPPSSPPSVLATPAYSSDGAYTISWTAPAEQLTHYELYESADAAFTAETMIYKGANLSHALTNSSEGDHYYRVKACNEVECSAFTTLSAPVQVRYPPTVPASISAPTFTSNGSYTVSWTAATGVVTQYELYESVDNTFASETQIYTGTNLSFALSSKVEGDDNYYRVRACNVTSCSNYTPLGYQVLVRYPPTPPASMTVPAANSTGKYAISWIAATGIVTHYKFYESRLSDFSNSKIVYSGNSLNANLDYKFDGSYYYQVNACNGPSCSPLINGTNPTVVTGSPYTAALIVIINSILLD